MAWKNVQYENGKYRTSEGGGGGSSTFANLEDVSFNNLQNGQVPKYNSETHKWENANESGGGGTVTDVQVDGVSVVNQQGVAEIEMPTPPAIPVEDVEVNGESVVDGNKVAQIKSYKEVTQAEYNALPASKTSDNILYAIKDAGGSDGFPPLIYSDEEREVGVWRDGKPLYQKTYHLASPLSVPTNSWIDTDIPNTGMQKIIFGFGNDEFDNGGALQSNSFMYLSFAVNAQNYVRVLNSRNATITLNYITLQYTKTTDTAGSGTWTTQGGYAHHYSTNEKVIGTWIDGKTLYEKTVFHNQSIAANSNNYLITCGLSNVDKVIDFDVTAINDSCFYKLPMHIYTSHYASPDYSANLQAYDKSTDKLRIDLGSRTGFNGGAIIILRYTKTTD